MAGGGSEGVLGKGDELAGHGVGGQDQIGQPGGDGGAGHAVELGRILALHHDHAPGLLDGPDAANPVAAGAREDDADGLVPLVFGQGTEEDVDGKVDAFGVVEVAQDELAVEDGELLSGRDEVDRVGRDGHAFLGAAHVHGRALGQQFHHEAFVVRRKVLDDDKRHVAVHRHLGKKGVQGFEPAG